MIPVFTLGLVLIHVPGTEVEEDVVAYSVTARGGMRIAEKKELQRRDLHSQHVPPTPLRDIAVRAERLRNQAAASGSLKRQAEISGLVVLGRQTLSSPCRGGRVLINTQGFHSPSWETRGIIKGCTTEKL